MIKNKKVCKHIFVGKKKIHKIKRVFKKEFSFIQEVLLFQSTWIKISIYYDKNDFRT